MSDGAASFMGDTTQKSSPGIIRRRGGFYRAENDTPWIADPSGELVKTGPRKGLPKRTPYGSPSGRGKQIENSKALEKWGERREALGIGLALVRTSIDGTTAKDWPLIQMLMDLVALDVDSDAYKELADKIIVAAKDIAEANLAADRGTHGHAILEDDDEGRNWIERAEAGELLGIPVEAQHGLVQAWRQMLATNGLVILATEASCVDDRWRLAGTLDNIARTSFDLRFRLVNGEIRTIPAGTVLVLDKKTGQRRTDKHGVIQYWHGYSIQVASYAQSIPYDTEAETRGTWPWEIDQTHALIAHLDVLAAIDGRPSCELVYVDLVAGREHGGACVVQAKAWEQRTDLFSISQFETGASDGVSDRASAPVSLISTSDAAPAATPTDVDEQQEPAVAATQPPAPVPNPARRDWIRDRCRNLAEHAPAAAQGFANHWPPDVPPLSSDHQHSTFELDRVERLLEAYETASSAPFVGGDPSVTLGATRNTNVPAEGVDVDQQTMGALTAALLGLPPDQFARCQQIAADAADAGSSISLSVRPSVRRYEIARGLYHLCVAGWDDGFVDELLTHLGHGGIPVGVALTSLDVTAAASFADIAAAYACGALIIEVQLDGSMVWRIGDLVLAAAA